MLKKVIKTMYPNMNNSSDDERKKEEEAIKESVVRRYLSPRARERLNNLALVNPALVKQVKDFIYNLAISGRLSEPLTDSQLKELLYRIQSGRKREYRFRGLW